MVKYKNFLYLAIAATFYCLGFPNILGILIPFLPIIGVTLLLKVIISLDSTKSRLLHYFFYNGIIVLLSFYWVTQTMQEFGKIPFIVAAALNGAFTFIFNPQYVVFILVLHLVENYASQIKDHLFSSGLSSVVMAIFMSLLEYFIPQQFPVMLGQPWIVFSEHLGMAPYFGLPIYSFISYLIVFEAISGFVSKKLSYLNLVSVLVFTFLNPFLVPPQVKGPTVDYHVRLVQANISNFLKVDSESGTYASVSQVLNRYGTLSVELPENKQQLDLIVWPETAYPYPLNTDNKNLKNTLVPSLFSSITARTKAPILFGGYDHFRDSPDNSYFQTEYNAALYLNSETELEEVYHKQILIPFGETLPVGPFKQWASTFVPEMAFFAEGSKFPMFKGNKNINFITSICYEILRPEFFRSYLNSLDQFPHMMINLTNDSWYGNTVEPEQHLFLARWRAIEFNLPILRSTNTGISTFIMANGQEYRRLEYDQTGNLDLVLKLPKTMDKNSQTIFQQYGLLAILPLWVLYFIFHLILIRLRHD